MSEFKTPFTPAAEPEAPVFHTPANAVAVADMPLAPLSTDPVNAADMLAAGSATARMRSDIVAGHVNRVIAEKTLEANPAPVYERSELAASLAEPFDIAPGHEESHDLAVNSAQAAADALFEKGVREAAVANAVRSQFDAAINAQADREIAELAKARAAETGNSATDAAGLEMAENPANPTGWHEPTA